jgi:uncharacterized membrane protein
VPGDGRGAAPWFDLDRGARAIPLIQPLPIILKLIIFAHNWNYLDIKCFCYAEILMQGVLRSFARGSPGHDFSAAGG